MPTTDKMVCPDCGVEMNHHADKIDYGAAPRDGAAMEEGGAVIEAHACPGCGRSATRRAGARNGSDE